MSTRGHRTQVQYADPLFKVSSEDKIYNFLENHEDTIDRRNCEGGGMIEVNIEAVKQLLDLDLTEREKDLVNKELAAIDGEEWILYDCF